MKKAGPRPRLGASGACGVERQLVVRSNDHPAFIYFFASSFFASAFGASVLAGAAAFGASALGASALGASGFFFAFFTGFFFLVSSFLASSPFFGALALAVGEVGVVGAGGGVGLVRAAQG